MLQMYVVRNWKENREKFSKLIAEKKQEAADAVSKKKN